MLKKRTGNLVNLKASALNIHLLSIYIYIFVFKLSNNLQRQQSNYLLVCKTQGGTRTDKPCQFPFIFKGKTYTTCTNVEEDFYWCSTETNDNREHQSGEWGKCDVGCSFGGIHILIT